MTYVAHYLPPPDLWFNSHSETHGRSCKKIKEKAIRSVGGSFSCRSRSMAHEVADTRTHTMCTQHIIIMDWIRDCIRLCHTLSLFFLSFFFFSFFYLFYLFILSFFFFLFFFGIWSDRCRTWASTAPSSDLHSRFGSSTIRNLFLSIYRFTKHRVWQDENVSRESMKRHKPKDLNYLHVRRLTAEWFRLQVRLIYPETISF